MSKKCPHCGELLKIHNPAEYHMNDHCEPIHAKTECCGQIVYCEPFVTYSATSSSRKEDDWGNRASSRSSLKLVEDKEK